MDWEAGQHSLLPHIPTVGILAGVNENTFWILTALAGGRRHGYAILRDVSELTDAKVSLRVTTLYASLDRLERDGLVARAGEEIVDGRARRYYELTDDGFAGLALETERLSVRLDAAARRLAAPRPAVGGPSPVIMVWGCAG